MSDSLYDKISKGEYFEELAEVFKDYSKVADVVNKRISNKIKLSYDLYKVTKKSFSTDRYIAHIYIKIGDLSAISLHDEVGRAYLHWYVCNLIKEMGITNTELESWCMYDFDDQAFALSLRWITYKGVNYEFR